MSAKVCIQTQQPVVELVACTFAHDLLLGVSLLIQNTQLVITVNQHDTGVITVLYSPLVFLHINSPCDSSGAHGYSRHLICKVLHRCLYDVLPSILNNVVRARVRYTLLPLIQLHDAGMSAILFVIFNKVSKPFGNSNTKLSRGLCKKPNCGNNEH